MNWLRRQNPLVWLGGVLLLGALVAGTIVEAPATVIAAQLSLPILVSVGLVGYGWYSDAETDDQLRRTVFLWAGGGIVGFTVVGFWFGQVTRQFETSFLLALVASLSTGIAFGATVGVYSARLKQTNAELEAKNDQLDQFVSIVSHDLRNPLTVAKGRLALVANDHDSDHYEPMERSLDRMEAMIEDLLTLARAGEQLGEVEALDLGVVCEQCWETVPTEAATLDVDTDRTVVADRDRLRQLLENLFRNSVEHGATNPRSQAHEDAVEHGHDTVSIRVGDLPDGFYVADDGPGIPEEDRAEVFESGFSTAETGTGFGLSIVAEIADAHGWDVTIAESVDGGARIEITGTGPE